MKNLETLERLFENESAFRKAAALVPFFYYFAFFVAFQALEGMGSLIARGSTFYPRFPIFWARFVSFSSAVQIAVVLFLLGALWAAFSPRYRPARIGACLGFLEYHALMSSFGFPYHQWDLWLWVSFLLVFLPDVKDGTDPPEEKRRMFLLLFWGVQAFILLTYTMSGIGKIAVGLNQFSHGEANLFSPDAAALHATTLLRTMRETVPLAPFVVRFPFLGWLGLLGVVSLELFSFLIAFRPPLHRLWAVFLVLFHVGTYLVMRAVFVGPSALLMLFFFNSPFQNPGAEGRLLAHVPLVGPLVRKLL